MLRTDRTAKILKFYRSQKKRRNGRIVTVFFFNHIWRRVAEQSGHSERKAKILMFRFTTRTLWFAFFICRFWKGSCSFCGDNLFIICDYLKDFLAMPRTECYKNAILIFQQICLCVMCLCNCSKNSFSSVFFLMHLHGPIWQLIRSNPCVGTNSFPKWQT